MVVFLLGLEEGRKILNIEDNHQLTPLDYALYYDLPKVAEVLLRFNAKKKPSDAMPLVLDIACCANNYLVGG